MASLVAPSQSSSTTLYCMAYVSEISSKALISSSALNDIAQVSIDNNKKNKITGILCYGDGYFFQYVEGSEHALTELKNKLLVDPRHQQIRILAFDRIDERLFEKWSLQSLIVENWLGKHPQIKTIIPFQPQYWQGQEWRSFVEIIHERYLVQQQMTNQPVQYQALGMTVSRLLGQHQVFLLVQAILTAMMIGCLVFVLLRSK